MFYPPNQAYKCFTTPFEFLLNIERRTFNSLSFVSSIINYLEENYGLDIAKKQAERIQKNKGGSLMNMKAHNKLYNRNKLPGEVVKWSKTKLVVFKLCR